MLEFVKTFDLLGSITQFLQERRQSHGISDDVPLRPRLLNQERGGLLIYTWNDLLEDAKVKTPVTHVGVYDPSTQKHKVLWIYNQKVRIVSCSLNRERTLLGFTIVTRQEAGQEGKSKDLYQAFLAELQSLDTRVFSLNLQRHSFLKVQFLYPDASPSSSSGSGSGSSRHSYMVVMLHKESVGLYQIPMARIGDRGIMMSGQPTTDQIVRKFVWCQWDAHNQRLYYIHNVRQSSSHADSVGHKLSAIQFHSVGKFDNMIDVPINFPFPYIRTSTRVSYGDIPLHSGIPDAAMNAVVLSQPNGSMCLCYQEHVSSSVRPKHTTPPSPLMTQPEDDAELATVDINYYVCMVHHAKTLHGCAAGLPRSTVAGKRVVFQWFGDYLVAAMPGVFCHLLNVSVDFEPCHHILLHNHDIPTLTKPPVPNSSSSGQSALKRAGSIGSKPSVTTTTDTSDPSQANQTMLLKVSSQAHEEEGPQALTSGSTSEGAEKAKPDHSVSSSFPSHNLTPPAVSLQTVSSSMPSPLRSHSVSPRVSGGGGVDLPDTLSVIDGESFQLSQPLVPCYGFFREAGSVGTNLYDASNGHIWRLASNVDRLLKSFKSAYWSSQLAILHYLILLRTRDLLPIKQVFEVLTADPTAPEIPTFLSEFLVASTFASLRKRSDRETTELLTFTSADTFRGQFEKNSQGERLARVTYTSLDSVNISTKMSHERRRRSSEDGWDLLRRSLRLKQMPPPSRFSHEHVLKALQKDIDSGSHNMKWTWVNHELEASFFDGMHTVKLTDVPGLRPSGSSPSEAGVSGGRQSRTESVLRATPLFLTADKMGMSELKKNITNVTEQLLVSHLMHHLKKESRIKAQNIAREYVACQMQQCRQLCHLLWSIHTDEETKAYEQLLPSLKEVGTDREYQLFQIYERVFLVTQELAFPRPSGFSSYFTSLGFKCLSSSVFLQYVDRGILQLTPDFILQLLEDLPDSDDANNAEIKFHIISRLPKPFAEDCFQRWPHPVLLKTAAQQQVAQVLQEGLIMTYRRSDGSADTEDRSVETRSRSTTSSTDVPSNPSAEVTSFKPLTIFIKHLEDAAMEVQRQRPGSMPLMYDTSFIEEAALSFTRRCAQFDWSTMNF